MRKLETEARLSSSVALHLVYRHTVPHLNPKFTDLISLAGQLARLLCVKMTGELPCVPGIYTDLGIHTWVPTRVW